MSETLSLPLGKVISLTRRLKIRHATEFSIVAFMIVKGKLVVISSFARDKIVYPKLNRADARPGGPAFWISRTLQNLGVGFIVLSGKRNAQVEIIVDKDGERGAVRSVDRIKVHRSEVADARFILISTILDEFDLGVLNDFGGYIIFDIQGYVRSARTRNKPFLPPAGVTKRIRVLKATAEEFANLTDEFIDMLRDAIILITKGKEGVDVFENRKKYSLPGSEIKTWPADTVGAGDVFLAAFTSQFLNGKLAVEAAEFAIQYAAQFLQREKGHEQ